MSFVEKKEKLDYMIELMRKECTGNADDLARRICVSRRTLFRYLDDLRALGYKYSYCQRRETYYLIVMSEELKRVIVKIGTPVS